MAVLVYHPGRFDERSFVLDEGTTVIGRAADCEISILDNGLSRPHSAIPARRLDPTHHLAGSPHRGGDHPAEAEPGEPSSRVVDALRWQIAKAAGSGSPTLPPAYGVWAMLYPL